MRSLEKVLSENNLEKWNTILWQNGYSTSEEFSEVTYEDLNAIGISDDTITSLLEIAESIKRELDSIEEGFEEECYYLETLYTGNNERMSALKQQLGVENNNDLFQKRYNIQTSGNSGICIPYICPVCLMPTKTTVEKIAAWRHVTRTSNGFTKSRRTQSEIVTLNIPCCHKKESKFYLDCWMERKGEVKFLIKHKAYAQMLVRLNGQRFPHEISISEYNNIKSKQLRGNIISVIWIFVMSAFFITMFIGLINM